MGRNSSSEPAVFRVQARLWISRALAGTMLLAFASGCAGVVTRTEPVADEPTRPVLLLDHGRHTSLVLTREDESLVRYLYGDWRWYAEGQTGLLRAVPTLFLPTRSALGRRELTGPPAPDNVRRQIRVQIDTIYLLTAKASLIDRLDQRLERHFAEREEEQIFNADYDLEFVPGPRPYTVFFNSNHWVADWLRELGIDARGNPVFGHWRVEQDGN